MQELPAVAVARDRYLEGASKLSDPVPSLRIVSFEGAFCEPWDSDAHFTTYRVVGSDPDAYPRMKKDILPRLRQANADLESTMFVLDYDNPGHEPWTRTSYQDFKNRLEALASEGFKLPLEATCYYSTRNGARFVYVLTTPLLVDQGEKYHRGLVALFQNAGLVVDAACSDWTRLFRLPYVFRDGTRTWEDDLCECDVQLERRLDPSTIPPADLRARDSMILDVDEIIADKPALDDALLLLREANSVGEPVETKWVKQARRRLKGRNCFPCLFDHRALAQAGSRMNTLQSYVGEAVALLYQIDGTSPELIYALFLDPVLQLEADHDTPDWTTALWRAVLRYYARERAKDAERHRELAVTAEQSVSLATRILEQMRTWSSHPGLHQDDDASLEWMRTRLIACTQKAAYILTPNGYYDSLGVPVDRLSMRIRQLGMDALMALEVPKLGGDGYKAVSAQSLIDRHGTMVSNVEGVVGGSWKGSTVRDIDSNSATLMIKLFDRKSADVLEPRYDSEVDQWLQAFGGSNYERLTNWIANSLAIEEGPICALSISGPPGCGKKMLVQGLAECIEGEFIADSKEFGRFQSGILRSPFLLVNEGFHHNQQGSRDPADTFRALVAGDPILVERKFQDVMLVRNPLRIIFTANNTDVVSMLCGKRDLSPEDRDALAQRLLHIEIDDTAKKWLQFRGNKSYTGREGRFWIRPDDGSNSDYVVARHFLWLHASRGAARIGQRFLVEGELGSDLSRMLSLTSGSAPLVIETLVRMVEQATPPMGMSFDDDRLWVTSSSVRDFFLTDLGTKINYELTVKSIASVLRGLSSTHQVKYPTEHWVGKGPTRKKLKARWQEVDPMILYESALEHGYQCNRLMKMASLKKDTEKVK